MIRTNNKVALYARFSSDNQRSESIDAQIRAMTAYCKQHNYEIVETYIDEAKTATTDRRPSFQQMIADSATRVFNIVLVHKLDRFARNRYDSAIYKRELKKNGVSVFSVLENLDDSPESVILEALLEGMSEYYSKNLSRETMKGMKETAYQCKHTGGKPPLGYDVDTETRKLVINPVEAETVRLIFDMYSQGYGYQPILKELHNRDCRTKKGVPFTKTSLYSILTNPKYQGLYVFNRSSAKSFAGTRNTHSYKDESEIIAIEGGCPQIVTKETYEKVQARMTDNKHKGARHNAKHNYLLSGKVFCKECGHSMTGNYRNCGRSKLPYITYKCPTNRHSCSNKEINKVYLERYVIKLLEDTFLNPSALKKISKEIKKYASKAPKTNSVALLERELQETEDALQNVADAVAQGLMSDTLLERLKELEERKTELQDTIANIAVSNTASYLDVDLILSDYAEVKDSPLAPMYKTFICSLIDRIDVGCYTVDITFKTGLDMYSSLDTTYNVRRQEIYEFGKVA